MTEVKTLKKTDKISNPVTQDGSTERLCLVTGGAGMIGSNLVKELVHRGFHVRVADNLWRGRLENLYSDAGVCVIDLKKDFFKVDLAVPGSCDAALDGVDFVYHLADVVAGIDYVFTHQGEIFRQNILINSNVIDSVRRFKPKGFIYVGTACSFPASRQNSINAIPLREEELFPAAPESAYGWSKLIAHYETELMEKEAGVPSATLILHNVYGVPTDYDIRTSQVIPSLILKAIQYPGQPFVVWGSGSQSRAFVHVRDIVKALLLTKEKGLGHGVIQIGPSYSTTIKELAGLVVNISKKKISIQYDPTRPEGDKARCADYSKAKRILGWEPEISLEEGLSELYAWIEKHM